MCGNMDVGNKLQAAELNAYLVAKDSFLVAKTFQKLKMKMCRGLYTRGMVGVAKKIAQLPVADPGRGARYPLKKKKKKKKKKGKKKHVDQVHDELKRDPYEDTDVEVDRCFKRAN